MSMIGCPGFTSIEKDGKDRYHEHVNFGASFGIVNVPQSLP